MRVKLDVRQPFLLGPGEGEAVADREERWVAIKASHDLLDVTESCYAPGERGPDAHVHRHHADAFYVLEGVLTLRLGEREVGASAGSYAAVPPGNVHTFSNPRQETVRLLNLMAPGGFEQYLKDAARAAAGGPPDPKAMAETASRYDFHPAG